MKEYTCNYCGSKLEYLDTEWAKYGMSDDEELVTVCECKKCKRKYVKRDGNFSLEERF
jgi:hypothetical protein